MFNPLKFNFIRDINPDTEIDRYSSSDLAVFEYYRTIPIDGHIIGRYLLEYDIEEDWWGLREIYTHNNQDREIPLYSGKIPDDNFGFQLLKNMELDLPVIQREIKIESLL